MDSSLNDDGTEEFPTHDVIRNSREVRLSTTYDALDMLPEVQDDNEPLFQTTAHLEWEKEYYVRLASKIHRLAVAELDRNEESLFMLFTLHDWNLDGNISRDEMKTLLKQVSGTSEEHEVDDVLQQMDVDHDGTVSFLELLRWWSGDGFGEEGHAEEHAKGSMRFEMVSAFVGVMGSGYLQTDDRIRALDIEGLRRNIIGYKRALRQLSDYKVGQKLEKARRFEDEHGLGQEAMQNYYNLLTTEFEGDMSLLFELFTEVDKSGNMLLEREEVYDLLRLLDAYATEEDLERYIDEINLEDGTLSYALLVDWWDQSREVANSLIAEKGATLLAQIRARSASSRFFSLLPVETTQAKLWKELGDKDPVRLRTYREGYREALLEVRRYKMTKRIREAEQSSAIP